MALHDNELRRRYHKIDFVSEFQKYWAYFNKWFKVETGKSKDRDSIEALKGNNRIHKIIADLLTERQEHVPLFNFSIPARDLTAYLTDNQTSMFVRDSWLCPIIRNSLNLFNPKVVNQVRGTATVHITIQEYRRTYTLCQEMEARPQFMSYEDFSMSRLFEYGKIRHVGSCFYRESQSTSAPQSIFYDACWTAIEKDLNLVILKDLRASSHNPGICSDLLEMLYVVRNKAVHGTLDFVDERHNTVSRSGLFLLQAIIEKLI